MILIRTQPHAWFHLLATVCVIAAGFRFAVTAVEWCVLTLAIGLVWTTEAINTAVEQTVDLLSPEYHWPAGRAKDLSAGAVLLAALTAAVIGSIILGPRLIGWWSAG